MKKFVVGNFKMNTTPTEFSSYLDEFLPRIKECKTNVIFCLPATHFHVAKSRLDATNIKFGAQNISCEESGAYTGEISSAMVKDCGANYTLVGHSEARRHFKETLEAINQKIIRALAVNLKVILCIGETKYERATKKTKISLKRQLDTALKGLYENELKNIIIAYEPIWAIGTGKTPNVKDIESTVNDIRAIIADNFTQRSADKISILYGGSINENNFAQFAKIKGISGLLVGGACLNPKSFANICK